MPRIDMSNWGKFKIGDLFNLSLSKDDIQPKNIIEGDIPLVSSGKENNGIIAHIEDDTANLNPSGTLTVDMFGKAFYQPKAYYCVSHGRVNILTPKTQISKLTGLFLAQAIESVSKHKYSFAEMCTGTKLSNETIRLPKKVKTVIDLTTLNSVSVGGGIDMSKIDTSAWKEFKVSELFGKAKLGKYHSPVDLVEDKNGYEYICASNTNNGRNKNMPFVNGSDLQLTSPNIIAWGKQCPYFTFHKEPCVTSQGVYYVEVGDLSEPAIHFIITSLNQICSEYNYSDCLTGGKFDDLTILLPATTIEEPDWNYMEEYMKTIEVSVSDSIEKLASAKEKEKKKIDVSGWGEFKVEELFETVKKGKAVQVPTGANISKQKLIEKSKSNNGIPRITVSNINNGITGYYEYLNHENYRLYENFISVSFLGTVFYQKGKASLDMKVHCLKPINKLLNDYTGKFLETAILTSLKESSYSDQISSSLLPILTIKLPITSTGEPDWAYMEEYMKQKERKVAEYLSTIAKLCQ